MKIEEFQHLSKNVKFIVNKFSENPGRFASIVIQMYWVTKDERDSYKQERDSLIEDITRLRAERDKLSKKLDEYCNVSLEIEGQLVEVSKERDSLISDIAKLRAERDEYKRKLAEIQNKDYFILSVPYDSAFGIYDTFEEAYKEGVKNKNEWLGLILHVSKINNCFFGDDIVGHFKNGEFIDSNEEYSRVNKE